jgi:hypothetical protein
LQGTNFYKASNLGGDSNIIDNAYVLGSTCTMGLHTVCDIDVPIDVLAWSSDQRVTADIVNFCSAISNLYTTIFKPLVDVILFSRKLMGVIGLKAPILLFFYYAFMGGVKRYIMPAFGKVCIVSIVSIVCIVSTN